MKPIFFSLTVAFALASFAFAENQRRGHNYKSDDECSQYELKEPNEKGEQKLFKNGKYTGTIFTSDGGGRGGIREMTTLEGCKHPTDNTYHRIKGHKKYRR